MKIVANVQPFVIDQCFCIVDENTGENVASFSTTLDKMHEDIVAQIEKYNISEVYLHGNEGFLDHIQKDITKDSLTKYSNQVDVHII